MKHLANFIKGYHFKCSHRLSYKPSTIILTQTIVSAMEHFVKMVCALSPGYLKAYKLTRSVSQQARVDFTSVELLVEPRTVFERKLLTFLDYSLVWDVNSLILNMLQRSKSMLIMIKIWKHRTLLQTKLNATQREKPHKRFSNFMTTRTL